MVAYSFKSRFVEPIRSGTKFQTIRNDRARHARPGETLQLYTAMRTKQCRLIGHATCLDVVPITIDFTLLRVTVAGRMITLRENRDAFAVGDGFVNWSDFVQWWRADRTNRTTHLNHSPAPTFSGVVVSWAGFADRWNT